MKLEYTGLKPVISERGISFKRGKEDKFKYLKFAIDIIKSIANEGNKNIQIKEYELSINDITKTLLEYHPNLNDIIEKEIKNYYRHLYEEKKKVKNKTKLTQSEKLKFLDNLFMMKKYKIQRAKNKIVYFHCIDTIISQIIENQIEEIQAPFNDRFWHVLQTIQSLLFKIKISSNLKTIKDKDTLIAKLIINLY